MTFSQRVATSVFIVGIGACALSVSGEPKGGVSLAPSAHAQGLIRNLIARLRGETLPDGIVKSNGRIEATQVDVSSKYAGRLAEVSVEEGSSVTQGQVIARISSPEYEAQLRAAEAQVQKSKDALAAAEAEIVSRQSALDFAKSDFERGQELMKTGFITKQVFEQRKRNYDSAVAAVQSFTSQRDQAQSAIKNAEAEVERIQSIISDLTLVSPRNGRVQYQLARAGEVVAAGAPIVTILDLTDVYMTIFLPAGDAGRISVGDEARIILDPVPDYVVPASVSFVAADAQFTPKTVETKDERAKLMFRMKLKVDPQVLQAFYTRVKTGVRGMGFVRTKAGVEWPADLQVKLPNPPQAKTPASAPPQATAPGAQTPDAKAPEATAPDAK
jgi:HlyD family secretion protein